MDYSLDEINQSLSSIAIGSSSKSLADVSWLDGPPKTEHSVVVPEWVDSQRGQSREKVIQLVVDRTTHRFPIEKYPASVEGVVEIRGRAARECRKGGVFFLWNAPGAASELRQQNQVALREFVRTQRLGAVERAGAIADELVRVAVEQEVSFIGVTRESLECVLEPLKKSLAPGNPSSLGYRLKKTAEPEKFFAGVLKQVAGIRAAEVAQLQAEYQTAAQFIRSAPREVPGVRPQIVMKARLLLE